MPKFDEYAPILLRQAYPDLTESQAAELLARAAQTPYGTVVANSSVGIVKDLDEKPFLDDVARLVALEPRLVASVPNPEQLVAAEDAQRRKDGAPPMTGEERIAALRRAQSMDDDARIAALPTDAATARPPIKPTPSATPTTPSQSWTAAQLDEEIRRAFGIEPGSLLASKRAEYHRAIRARSSSASQSLEGQGVESGAIDAKRLTPTERIRLHREEQARQRKAGSK